MLRGFAGAGHHAARWRNRKPVNLPLTASLSPLWTFSRASSGTQINSGVLSTAITNVARFETSPAGWLGEPQATNLVPNNTMVGGSAPSTLPTGWSLPQSISGAGNTTTFAYGTEYGMQYIDTIVSVVSMLATAGNVFVEWAPAISPNIGSVYTGSMGHRLVSGALPVGFSVDNLVWFQSVSQARAAFTPTSVYAKSTATGTCPALTTNIIVGWQAICPALLTYAFTIRTYLPQLEVGSFATSNITTTTASATRAADNLTLDLTQLPGLQTAGGYSCAIEFSLLSNTQSNAIATGIVFGMSGSGGFSNTWYCYENGAGGLGVQSIVAGVGAASSVATLRAVGLTNRLALTVTPAGITFNLNGAGDVTVTNAGMPTMTTLAVLRAPWNASNYEAGHVTLVTLVPGPQSAAWRAARAY